MTLVHTFLFDCPPPYNYATRPVAFYYSILIYSRFRVVNAVDSVCTGSADQFCKFDNPQDEYHPDSLKYGKFPEAKTLIPEFQMGLVRYARWQARILIGQSRSPLPTEMASEFRTTKVAPQEKGAKRFKMSSDTVTDVL
jgi:hypothetical protein